MFASLSIESPKLGHASRKGWSGFFPYYAGFPESFATSILSIAESQSNAVVLDPWNGSGTTTYAASLRRLRSIGLDLNPAMMVVAKARLLPVLEVDSIEPLGKQILRKALSSAIAASKDDPLLIWFGSGTASFLRALENAIRDHLVGEATLTRGGPAHLDQLSATAATHYAALFAVCRELAGSYRTTNPTWLREPSEGERRVGASSAALAIRYQATLAAMAAALAGSSRAERCESPVDLRAVDTCQAALDANSVSLILTSPPYCTRLDYTSATRVELAVLSPLLGETTQELARKMMGSVRVPVSIPKVLPAWGPTCLAFLNSVQSHPSKASAGYYYKTHSDYFDKLYRSLLQCASALRVAGGAVFVVQDSFYKNVHNDLPVILTEMCAPLGLRLKRRENFSVRRSMAQINPHARAHVRASDPVEAVLCFQRE